MGWICSLTLEFTGANMPFLNTQLLIQDAEGGNLSYYLNYSTQQGKGSPLLCYSDPPPDPTDNF